MIYLPLPMEVDCCEAILYAWQLGRSVAVPKISWQQRHMIPVEINSLETDFSIEAGGLKNPVTGVPVPLAEIDLVVAPALGFDKKGNRLGRGGAYYDRFFASDRLKAAKCGLAFQEQVVDSLPTNEYDKAVDFLVTDEGVTYFNFD
jgi:5-formyltetrahydrofolate cyclo-ligase